jgi:GMP synthase-like glutamine amidotransferase
VRILAVTHGDNVGPELFAEVAEAEGHELQAWDIERQGRPPRTVDAVAVFGGHQNVGEEHRYPWLHDEYDALRDWVDDGVPVFAVCLGAQTLAHALGGRVTRLDEPLAGFYETQLTDDGAADPVLGALPRTFAPFNGNAYACEVPPGATLLATGPCVQAYRAGGRAWAVQFHPELKRSPVQAWFGDGSRPNVDLRGLEREAETGLADWQPLGARLFRAFLASA